MSKYGGTERRKTLCDACVRDDFNTVKKLVFTILAACVLSGGLGAYSTTTKDDRDSQQDSRLTAVESNQKTVIENQHSQSIKLDQLIQITTQIRITAAANRSTDENRRAEDNE